MGNLHQVSFTCAYILWRPHSDSMSLDECLGIRGALDTVVLGSDGCFGTWP